MTSWPESDGCIVDIDADVDVGWSDAGSRGTGGRRCWWGWPPPPLLKVSWNENKIFLVWDWIRTRDGTVGGENLTSALFPQSLSAWSEKIPAFHSIATHLAGSLNTRQKIALIILQFLRVRKSEIGKPDSKRIKLEVRHGFFNACLKSMSAFDQAAIVWSFRALACRAIPALSNGLIMRWLGKKWAPTNLNFTVAAHLDLKKQPNQCRLRQK